MQNPVDGDATYRKKNDKEYRGYSTHAAETCDPENKMQVITNVTTTKNNVDDAETLKVLLPSLKKETGIETMVTDGAYVSNDTRNECKENNITFITSAIRGKTSNNKLNSLSFEYDEYGLITKCPSGFRPNRQRKEINGDIIANFDVKICNS